VLHELAERQAALCALPVDVRFFLRGPAALSHPALAQLLRRWPGVQVLLDDWDYDLEAAARRLALDPERPPLCLVCDRLGRARYGLSGYRVGAVGLLEHIAAQLCAHSDF